MAKCSAVATEAEYHLHQTFYHTILYVHFYVHLSVLVSTADPPTLTRSVYDIATLSHVAVAMSLNHEVQIRKRPGIHKKDLYCREAAMERHTQGIRVEHMLVRTLARLCCRLTL